MGKNRVIVYIVLGYIIGILWGLYLDISIVLLYLITYLIFKIISFTRIYKYIKLLAKPVTIILIIISSLISNTIITNQNKKYENIFKQVKEVELIARVIDNGTKKQYSSTYTIKIEELNHKSKYKGKKVYLKSKGNLKYGDMIYIKGEFIEPEVARNYKGFDYKEYLKTKKIYGTIQGSLVEVVDTNRNNKIFALANNTFLKIKEGIEQNFDDNTSGVLLGILLGNTEQIDNEIKQDFSNSNISHILAVSGMHISYIVIGLTFILDKVLGKRKSKTITIVFLNIYMFITGFSPSVVRASIMTILFLLSKVVYRKNDIWTSISISILILLIYNPFLIKSSSVQFTYVATIGIIIMQKNILNFFKSIKIKDSRYKLRKRRITNKNIEKILNSLYEILSVSFSAQIAILPISIMTFNAFGLTFFITNFFTSFIIPPIIIIGLIFISLILFGIKNVYILNEILKFFINILITISKIGSNLPFSKILITTPKVWQVLIYYILVVIINYIYSIWNKNKKTFFQQRIKNMVYLIKYKMRENKQFILKILIIFIVILIVLNTFIMLNRGLKIYFIDVGQGDSTLIVTPCNQTILIDGGGSEFFEVGKNTLTPYLLDRNILKIDYMFISHFDTDHVGGLLGVMEDIKVKNVIIGKQFETCDNYKKFLNIVKEKKIKVYAVETGRRLTIENDLYFDILWPSTRDKITENVLNNNSLVCKMVYKQFSCLFTGDIEEVAEKAIVQKYKDTNILKSTVLKVAHHGSKSSSTEEFLNAVKFKIALIGVGKNNTFGHPNAEVLKRIERGCK